jgi:hypothetical protein
MDAFKITIIVAVLASLAVLGGIVVISQDAINNAKIPEVQKDKVVSKTVIENGYPANFSVTLASGQVLYILDDSALYDSILINQTYQFDCRLDFKQKIIFIETATLQDQIV